MTDLPALDAAFLPAAEVSTDAPRFLLLYGSLRPQSVSHLLVEEAGRILRHMGGAVRIFNPADLPMPGATPPGHAKVAELHDAALWSDAQFWCTPENYGTPSAVLKAQIDSCPPVIAGKPLFAGRPLATAQVNGAGSTFSSTMALAGIGRWLGMFVTPSLYAVAKAHEQFGEDGRMIASADYDRLVDLCEELFRLTLLMRDQRDAFGNTYSKRRSA